MDSKHFPSLALTGMLGLAMTLMPVPSVPGFGSTPALAQGGGHIGAGGGIGHAGGAATALGGGHATGSSSFTAGSHISAFSNGAAGRTGSSLNLTGRTGGAPSGFGSGRVSATTSGSVSVTPHQTRAAAAALGDLNAAHASPQALAHASPNSTVGRIATYDAAMRHALTLRNPTDRAAAITAARAQLAAGANKPLTPQVAARVDGLLGLPAR